jgi:hypothetical protein
MVHSGYTNPVRYDARIWHVPGPTKLIRASGSVGSFCTVATAGLLLLSVTVSKPVMF